MVEAVQALPLEVDMPQAVVLEVEVDIPQVPEVSGPVLSPSQREQRALLRVAKEVRIRIGHTVENLYNYTSIKILYVLCTTHTEDIVCFCYFL